MSDVVNFVNFERDGTVPLHEFEIILSETFKIQAPKGKLDLLCQRYRVKGSPLNKQIVSVYMFL